MGKKLKEPKPTAKPTGNCLGDTTSTPGDSPKPRRQVKDTRQQLGNSNATKHGAFSADVMNGRKKLAKTRRDDHRRAAEKEVDAILRQNRLGSDAMAKYLGRQLVRAETMAARLEAYVQGRGCFTRTGGLQPAAARLIEVTSGAIGEARRLLEAMLERNPGGGERKVFVCTWRDGREAPPGGWERNPAPPPPAPEPAAPKVPTLTPDDDGEWTGGSGSVH